MAVTPVTPAELRTLPTSHLIKKLVQLAVVRGDRILFFLVRDEDDRFRTELCLEIDRRMPVPPVDPTPSV